MVAPARQALYSSPMFTGIIRHRGRIIKSYGSDTEHHLTIETSLAKDLTEGDSIAVNGACLTILKQSSEAFDIRLMAESIARTNLAKLSLNDHVNLELPLAAGDTLDGHFVTGHVDGVATISDITPAGHDLIFTLQPPNDLMRYFVPKGTVALAGISLTVVSVNQITEPTGGRPRQRSKVNSQMYEPTGSFTVSVMPYTLEHTTLGNAQPGDTLNIEADMLAKHAINATERYLANQPQQT